MQQRDGASQEAIDRLIQGLGGRTVVERAAVQRTRATGSRHHPGWGMVPNEPELVAEFLFDLVEDLNGPRYRLQLSGPTHLVPVNLDYIEIGDGLSGHVAGVDFMFDPSPVDGPIPSWRVAARQRHIDLTSPLRIARKILRGDVEVCYDEAAGELILEEREKPALHLRLTKAGELASVWLTTGAGNGT